MSLEGSDMVFADGNFNVKGCVCTVECECPCWQRVGLEEPGRCCCESKETADAR